MIFSRLFGKIKRIYPQALAACAVWIIMTEVGLMVSWSSPYLAQLTAPNSPIPLNYSEGSWVASILYTGRFVGAVLGSICVNYFGSRITCLITAVPMAAGWLITLAADSVLWLCVARVSLGMGFGFAYSCFALYLGEVSAPEIRGALVSFAVMGAPVGNFLAGFTGMNMSLFASSISYFVPCITLIALLTFLPDSPHHLVKIGNYKAARKSIEWYHCGVKNVDDELREVTAFVNATTAATFTEKLAEFRLRHVRKATFLAMMLFVFMQMCGLNNVLFYMEIILQKSKSTIIEPSTAVSYVLLSSVIVSIASMRLYDKFGRRLLLIISSTGISVSLVVLGTHFILLSRGFDWIGAQYLPVVSLLFFNAFFNTGLNSIPSIVSSEIYAANIKSVAACFANVTAAAAAFIASKSYQPLVDLFGEAYVFYIHAFITFLAVPYALLFMPETKGKTLQQIQNDLMRKK